MAGVTIRNLSEETHRAALKCRAKAKGKSTEAAIRSILDEAVAPTGEQVGLGTALANLRQYLDSELVIETRSSLRRRDGLVRMRFYKDIAG